jgi:hypothetical protein
MPRRRRSTRRSLQSCSTGSSWTSHSARGMDVKDGNTAAVAGAHAALALYHQREADREQPSGEVTQP